jgi:opacity protein-like surface antigen
MRIIIIVSCILAIATHINTAGAMQVEDDDACCEHTKTAEPDPAEDRTSETFENSKPREGFYIEAKGGVDKPEKLTEHFKTFDKPKSAAILEVRGGYNFEKFAVDVSIIHSPKNKLTRQTKELIPIITEDSNFKHNSDIKFTAIALNAYYNIIHYKGFTPYIGVGAGISRNTLNKIEVDSDFPNPGGPYSPYRIRTGSTTSNFMWQATVGGKYLVNDNFEVSLECKYIDLGKFKTGGSSTNFTPGMTGTTQDPIQTSKLKTYAFLAGIRYYF